MPRQITHNLLEIESSPILSANSVASLCLDATGAIQDFDAHSEKLFGCAASDVMEQQITTLLPDLPRSAFAHDAPPAGRVFNVAARRFDGSRLPIEATLSRVQAGPHLRWVMTLRAPKNEGSDQSRLLQAVIEGSADAIYVKDRQSRYLVINAAGARLIGKPASEIVGKTDTDLAWSSRAREMMAQDCQIMASGQTVTYEDIQTFDGVTRAYSSTKGVYRDAQGRVIGLLGISRDITERTQAADAQRESEARYGRIAANVPGMVYQFVLHSDGSFHFPYVSEGCRELYELEPAQIYENPQSIISIIHPEDQESFRNTVAASAHFLQAWNWEGRITTPAGKTKWIQGASRPERLANGETLWDGLLLDITERKAAEEVLRRLSLVASKTTNGVVITDAQGRTEWINDGFTRITGYSLEEMQGQKPGAVLQGSDTDPATLELVRARLRDGQGFAVDIINYHKTGYPYWIHVDVTPIFDRQGKLAQFIAVETDITERKRTEEALRRAHDELEMRVAERTTELALTETKYRTIYENTVEGIFQTTPDGSYLSANPALARIYGYDTPEELRQALTRIDRQLYVDPNRRAEFAREMATGIVTNFESEVRRKDGSTVWISENARAVRDEAGRLLYYEGTVEDITVHKQAEAEIISLNAQLERRVQRLAALRDIDTAIMGSSDLDGTLQIIADQAREQLSVDGAAVLLCDQPARRLGYAVGSGFDSSSLPRLRQPIGFGHAGQAAREERIVYVPDLRQTPATFEYALSMQSEGFVSYWAVPLVAKGKIKGVLEVFSRRARLPDAEWHDFLVTLAGQAAIAIDNLTLFDGLERSNRHLTQAYDATIEGLSRALDLRDEETEGHSRRVTELTLRLAEGLGLSDAELVHIRRGALLHDIGKMGVPDGILLKPGKLTDEEWEIMRRHPTYAMETLSPIAFLQPALDIPYCHHEKWDGTGYPRGLKGDEIPLSARLFAIVDVWDALRSDRPYRLAWSAEKVREHVRSLSGTHFDPHVVDIFLQIVTEEAESLPPALPLAA